MSDASNSAPRLGEIVLYHEWKDQIEPMYFSGEPVKGVVATAPAIVTDVCEGGLRLHVFRNNQVSYAGSDDIDVPATPSVPDGGSKRGWSRRPD